MIRRLHVAGSAHRGCDAALLGDTHDVVRGLVDGWVRQGGAVVGGLGPSPRHESIDTLETIFDWTVAETVLAALRAGGAQPRTQAGHVLCIRASRNGLESAPADRRDIFDELTERGAIDLELLPDGWRSGALMRRAQATHGSVLVTFSGGAGVEDLAELYLDEARPVIPVDVDLGSWNGDAATGGGTGLARRALNDARPFMALRDGRTAGAELRAIALGPHHRETAEIVRRLLAILADLALPTAFCVRLLDRSHKDHDDVEWYFRNVVDPVLGDAGLRVVDLGRDQYEQAWMNAEIFERLHRADLVFAELTAARPNCFIELGYALGRPRRTVLAAREGEHMPFDIDKLPWHFWDPRSAADAEQEKLRSHLAQYEQPAPLVPRILRP